jgi:hypothetical protein
MESAIEQFDTPVTDEPVTVLSRDAAAGEDAHWERAHRRERYFRPGLDYEDYAPAYCVGYIGFAQYGGRFEDAERSLYANWVRIKGDSRLPLEDALLAMRAAWDRMALRSRPGKASQPTLAGLIRRLLGNPSLPLRMRPTR